MKRFVVGVLAAIGLLALLGGMAAALVLLISIAGRPGVPRHAILEIDFEGGIVEVVPEDPVAELLGERLLEVRDVVEGLERAASDSRVRAVIGRLGGEPMPMAQIQEVREAVQRFRESGKPAIAFAETFGEFGPGNGGYYLATAFDEIYVPPSGDVGLTGLMYESMFLRGLFDKLDVVPRMDQRHQYKNAMNVYTDRAMTEAHREALGRVMESRFQQIVDGIASARGKTSDEVRALIDRGPFLGPEALEAGFVDGLAYRDEVYERVRERAGGERSELLYLSHYIERAGAGSGRGTTVALIHGYGAVTRGPSAYSVLDGSQTMGADTVTRAFRAAIDDRAVKAILFRVDSPGGSYVASDLIFRETQRAREAGKPVIVSMGNLAGSGGYFVAMGADRIVAQPGTVTGSIGVLGGKLLTREGWHKLGITFDDVRSSDNAEFWSPGYDYDEEGFLRFQAWLDRVYEDFTHKVAEHRELDLESVLQIARGRIWTGADALELGLVDELGGYPEALDAVRAALELEDDAPIRLKRFPRKRSPWESLFGEKPDSSERVALRTLASALRTVRPGVRALRELGVLGDPQVLSMTDVAALD